jgi:hypothetical protein
MIVSLPLEMRVVASISASSDWAEITTGPLVARKVIVSEDPAREKQRKTVLFAVWPKNLKREALVVLVFVL